MRILILSDIHSNLPAFTAVLEDAKTWDKVIFLGDVANFGPHPRECVELLQSLNPIAVIGNHDVYISQNWVKKDVNQFDVWSRSQLTKENILWLRALPETLILENVIKDKTVLLTHGAFGVPYDILPGIPDCMLEHAFDDQIGSRAIDEIWFGHYHYQLDRQINERLYCCIRPVGHHRDHDIRAGYSIYENGEMVHHRVSYDIEKTIRDTYDRMTFLQEPLKHQWIDLLEHAWNVDLLKKDMDLTEQYSNHKNG